MGVKLKGINNFKRKVENKKNYVNKTTNQVLDQGTRIIESSMKMDVPVDTGNLRNNIRREVRGNDYIVSAETNYARHVERRQKRRGQSFFIRNVKRGIELIKVKIRSM